MNAVLQIANLTREYPGPQGVVCAVQGVSLSLQAGEFVAVQGHRNLIACQRGNPSANARMV